MRVVVPFVPRMLTADTLIALRELCTRCWHVSYYDVSRSVYEYAAVLNECLGVEDVIICEHDVVPMAWHLDSLERCDMDFCAYGYIHRPSYDQSDLVVGLGLCKISARKWQRDGQPIPADIPFSALDVHIWRVLGTPHIHDGSVNHMPDERVRRQRVFGPLGEIVV